MIPWLMEQGGINDIIKYPVCNKDEIRTIKSELTCIEIRLHIN